MPQLRVLDTLGLVISISDHSGESVNSNGLATVPGSVDGRDARWEPHRKARRDVMVREVRAIVHEIGPDISMEEIAVGLGTSKSVLYRYFGDKNGLQAALGEYTLSRTRAQLMAATRDAPTAELALQQMMRTYLEIVARSRNVFMFVHRPAGRSRLQSFVEQVESMVAEVLSAEADGVPAARVELWASAAVGLVRGAAEHWAQSDDRIDISELSADLTAMLWHGAQAVIVPTS